MSWKIAIVVALLAGLVTAVITAPVADHVTKAMKVSDREGGRGMAIAFLFIPAGFIGGLLLGLLATKLSHATEWGHFWKAEGIALAMSLGGVGIIAGLCLLSIDRPPLLDGCLMDLEAEVYVPRALQPKGTTENALRMSLYATRDDNRYVDIDRKRLKNLDDQLVIPVRTPLHSVAPGRMLTLTVDDSVSYTLDMPLQAVPRKADLEWTDRMPMRLSKITGTGYTYTEVFVRYRVVKAPKEATSR